MSYIHNWYYVSDAHLHHAHHLRLSAALLALGSQLPVGDTGRAELRFGEESVLNYTYTSRMFFQLDNQYHQINMQKIYHAQHTKGFRVRASERHHCWICGKNKKVHTDMQRIETIAGN